MVTAEVALMALVVLMALVMSIEDINLPLPFEIRIYVFNQSINN